MLFSLFIYINAQKGGILHGPAKYFCKNNNLATRSAHHAPLELTQSKTVMSLWLFGQRFITVKV